LGDGRVDRSRPGRRTVDSATVDRWCHELHATRDPELRAALAQAHQWLVMVCVRRMMRRGEMFDDLVQVGNIGLMKALDRFDPAFGVSFNTFASATIVGELRRHYRTVWRLKVPRSLQERYAAVKGAVDELTSRAGRTPTPQQVAAHLRIDLDDVLEALAVGSAMWVGSLTHDKDDESYELPSVLASTDTDLESSPERVLLMAQIGKLAPVERVVVCLNLLAEVRQAEIGERLGISQVQVSRILRRALGKLRELMREDSAESAVSTG
jgi:RNA polymerase sigma-B factor